MRFLELLIPPPAVLALFAVAIWLASRYAPMDLRQNLAGLRLQKRSNFSVSPSCSMAEIRTPHE